MTTLMAPIAGPLLGGYISDNYVWPWIFLINVPVGIVCAFICWNNLKSQETPTRKLPIDRVGLVLLFVWVGALQIMLDKGKDLDWFNSPSDRGAPRRHGGCVRRVAHLEPHRGASHRRLEPVQVAQLRVSARLPCAWAMRSSSATSC